MEKQIEFIHTYQLTEQICDCIHQEINLLYTESSKKSVLDYILLDPKEQERLKVCILRKVKVMQAYHAYAT